MDLYEWVMSIDNPTRAKYVAHRLWKQGVRSSDRTIIVLCYGHTEHEADILCEILKCFENRAKDYNPDIGF